MSLQAVENEILTPMQQVYLPPRQLEKLQLQALLKQYADALDGFDAQDLKASWGLVRDSHLTRGWPVPAQFVVGARLARKDRLGAEADTKKPDSEGAQQDHWPLWVRASKTAIAREAVRLNVAWAFKCAVLHDGRPPEVIILRDLVSAKASAERTAERIRKQQSHERKGRNIGVFSEKNAALALKMWAGLQQRETETQQEINYGAGART